MTHHSQSLLFAFLLLQTWSTGRADGQDANTYGFQASFLHGVASGDPTPEGVVIWTRATPRDENVVDTISVSWYVAQKSSDLPGNIESANSFSTEEHHSRARGELTASRNSDYTVKVDVRGLPHGKTYYYVFMSGLSRSPVGRFKVPLPQGQHMEHLSIAAFSCSNWGWGYFNAYDLAARYDLDAWIHLGDYIYEYDNNHYPYKSQAVRGWGLQPEHEIITLQDYRLRHATYRKDRALQALSASAALIATWDDHEIANNPWVDGAENHNEGEGDWETRKAAAVQAYHEWLPTRDTRLQDNSFIGPYIYRKMEFGDLATLLVLETRLVARTNGEADPFPDTDEDGDGISDNDSPSTAATMRAAGIIGQKPPSTWNSDLAVTEGFEYLRGALEEYRRDESKRLLGTDQLSWITTQIAQSKAAGTKWQLFGQQIILADRMMNVEAAIDEKDQQGNHETAAKWREALLNITLWDCEDISECTAAENFPTFLFEDPTAYNSHHYGQTMPVTSSTAMAARIMYALQKYKIPNYFDDWEGYFAAREQFLETLHAAGGTAVVYGGDSHNAWASEHITSDGKTVCAEFDTTSVTSTGNENFIPFVPQAMLEASFVKGNVDNEEGANYKGELRYTEQKHKGFSLFTITHEKHHAEFLYVDTIAAETYSTRKCDAFDFTYDASESRNRMKKSECSAIPHARPYEFNGLLPSHLCGCEAGECSHGCHHMPKSQLIEENINIPGGNISPPHRKPNDFTPLLAALLVLMAVTIVYLYLRVLRLSKTIKRFHNQTDEDLEGEGFL